MSHVPVSLVGWEIGSRGHQLLAPWECQHECELEKPHEIGGAEPMDILIPESQSQDSYIGAAESCPQGADIPKGRPTRTQAMQGQQWWEDHILFSKHGSCVCLHDLMHVPQKT